LMLPVFQKTQVATYRNAIVDITQRFLDRWRVGSHIDMLQELRQLTLRIVTTVLFGFPPEHEVPAVARLLQQWMMQFTAVGVHVIPKQLPGSPYQRLLHTSARLEHELRLVIADKRAAGSEHHDVLSQLIEIHDEQATRMTDTELIGHANLLFIAG